MRIDSHQHFWRYSNDQYPWIQGDWPIRRNYLPEDLEPELRDCSIDGCVAVQARQSLAESKWLLDLADRAPFIKGVVGWVDLRSPSLSDQLAELCPNPKFVGVRHVVQDEPDDNFMLRKDFQDGIAQLEGHGLAYDILIYSRHLPAAVELVKRFPQQRFVLDHLAKPMIRDGVLARWREQIRKLAQYPNVMGKVSGLVTEARWNGWEPDDFKPYLDAVFEDFGPDRLMFGSDWPVALLAASYRQVYSLISEYVSGAAPDAAANIFGLNAQKFYDL
ncbi:MAG TPA: amidohydrolase family protein [Verrucomicrobiae bacterium]|nr:amidohydrolase family protein [Verrucomicrobiae bacterium]